MSDRKFDLVIYREGCPTSLAALWSYFYYLGIDMLPNSEMAMKYYSKIVQSKRKFNFVEHLLFENNVPNRTDEAKNEDDKGAPKIMSYDRYDRVKKDSSFYKNRNILFLDFMFYEKSDMNYVIDLADHVFTVNHRREARNCIIDLYNTYKRSGKYTFLYEVEDKNYTSAELIFTYLFPHKKIPEFIRDISDRALWRWGNNTDCDAFYITYICRKMGFYRNLVTMNPIGKLDRESLVSKGRAQYRYDQTEIDELCAKINDVKLVANGPLSLNNDVDSGWDAKIIINQENHPQMLEVGNKILKDEPRCSLFIYASYDLASSTWILNVQTSKKRKEIKLADIVKYFAEYELSENGLTAKIFIRTARGFRLNDFIIIK